MNVSPVSAAFVASRAERISPEIPKSGEERIGRAGGLFVPTDQKSTTRGPAGGTKVPAESTFVSFSRYETPSTKRVTS